MRILIIGASQGTGALATGIALERGHEVTAFSRTPTKLILTHPRLTRVAGDFHVASSVAAAVPGHDAVVVTASGGSLKAFRANPNYFSAGTAHVIAAMQGARVKRLVVLSAFGVGDSRRLANFIVDKLVISFLLRVPFEDHERQERLVRASGLDWVLVRPTRLTNGPASHRAVAKTTLEAVPSSISRADVAEFLIRSAESDTYVGQAVQLGG